MKKLLKTNQMKKISILMFSCLTLLVISSACSSDNESSTPNGSILGRWALDKESITANGVTSPDEDYVNSDPGCVTKDYIEFRADEADAGFYYADCTVNISTGTYVRAGNMITITYGSGDPSVLEVMSVTSTVLKLRTRINDAEPGVEAFVNFTLLKVQ